jgi:hypothetical protein
MSNETSTRFPRLGKLSTALLEHLVDPVIGQDARDIIKAPVIERELQTILAEILIRTEAQFINDYDDKDLGQVLVDLPLATLPSVQSAIRDFYNHPTDTALQQILIQRLSDNLPKLEQTRIKRAVNTYLEILKQHLIAAAPSPELREKLSALEVQSIHGGNSC